MSEALNQPIQNVLDVLGDLNEANQEQNNSGNASQLLADEQFNKDQNILSSGVEFGNANEGRFSQGDDQEVPHNKDHLLEYLKNQLMRAEGTMTNLYVIIEIEREKRDALREDLNQERVNLDEVKQVEEDFFKEKVETRITPAMRRAIEDRVIAENEKAVLDEFLKEKELMIQELDNTSRNLHESKCKREIHSDEAQYRINEQESQIDSYNGEIHKLINSNNEKDQEISELKAEIDDMKNVVETLILMRAKLNHYIPDTQEIKTRKEPKQWALFGKTTDSNFSDGNGRDKENQERRSKTFENPDDFWYAEHVKKSKPNEPKKGNYGETYPWNPKVQNVNTMTIEQKRELKSLADYNASAPTIKLPSLLGGKQEHLFKNQEFMDEFVAHDKAKEKKKNTYQIIYTKKKVKGPNSRRQNL